MSSQKLTISMLCSSEDKEGMAKKEGKYLPCHNNRWKNLDPSCLGDGLDIGDEESCGANADSNGNQ